MNISQIAIIGLGYVGLPLAVEFGKKYKTIGFDINLERIKSLAGGIDETLEVSEDNLLSTLVTDFSEKSNGFKPTNLISDIQSSDVYIITVPTPVDENNYPDFKPIISATKLVGSLLSDGNIVIYESTVHPGATEEICVPILEEISKLKFNDNFFVGYSPERINPGDKEKTLTKILKITSGSTIKSSKIIDDLYKSIIEAGTYLAPSIKVAEAAKVIENAQRDINIAFVNELAKIFNLMNINTNEVLKAAGTKWNFLDFKPGLVGGHCIGVDPYYLAKKAQDIGYNPKIILSGRNMNDSMANYVASQIHLLASQSNKISNSEILILGVTFKENCPDFRNTKVVDLIKSLKKLSYKITIYDPWVDKHQFESEYGLKVSSKFPDKEFKIIVHAVSHNQFENIDYSRIKEEGTLIYDVKSKISLADMSL